MGLAAFLLTSRRGEIGAVRKTVAELRAALEAKRGDLAGAVELMAAALEIDRDAGLSRPRGLHARMPAGRQHQVSRLRLGATFTARQ